MEFDITFCAPPLQALSHKKRKITDSKYQNPSDVECCLPILRSWDYYTIPPLKELAAREAQNPGYCTHVNDFVVGRVGYGRVKFFGETDVRYIDLDRIVKFNRHEVIVYEDESEKPDVGEGLNKRAEVILVLKGERLGEIIEKVRVSVESQGGKFVSYDSRNREWKFLVQHFSRFGFSEDDEEDVVMDDVNVGERSVAMNGGNDQGDGGGKDFDGGLPVDDDGSELSRSLPAHLGLDPVKMREMKMLMFPVDGKEDENYDTIPPLDKHAFCRERSPLHPSEFRMSYGQSPPMRKTPLPLLEYKSSSFDLNARGTVLMTQNNKGLALRTAKTEGFKLDSKHETPVSGYHSRNIVDAALFMGRSFRVGWGPNGVLVHCGTPVGSTDHQRVLSSVINLEKVAIDKVARVGDNKVKEEAVGLLFNSPLDLHKSMHHETEEVQFGSFRLSLRKVVCDRIMLPDICRRYIEVVERQLELPGLPPSTRVSLMHQVMVWELIKVLFSERETSARSKIIGADNEEDMMQDEKVGPPEIDLDALPLVRRAEFSYWLQESVYHRVQEEVSCLSECSDLEHIFLFLTGRQLDAAVELAASRGDVRLSCLLSQAGGSTVNRSDISQQLDLWGINGMDYSFIEKERLRLYELLSCNIHGALVGKHVDWKRFLGLLMWYELPPDTALPFVFQTYQHLLAEGKAPYPVPLYIDEGPVEETTGGSAMGQCYDLAYYLMLLHACEDSRFGDLKSMFSAFASTSDPLDYHMIWHQRAILEAIGAFSSDHLHILDIGFVSQLLCLGQCHWAIYVILHMSYREDFPYMQSTLIREILFQYCDAWSSQEQQRHFIEHLGVPSEWLHEAMAVYYQYYGDLPKALEHFIDCASWPRAHSLFMTSVAHSLFLSAKHSEIWRLATSMEVHKSEIEDWDLGAGIYVSFYLLRSSLRGDDDAMNDLDSLKSKDASCREFLDSLNKSLEVWENRLPVDARVAYSKMAEEICSLLLSDSGDHSTRETQLRCFDTMAAAPIPEDVRSCRLQDAISLFTCFLSETAS